MEQRVNQQLSDKCGSQFGGSDGIAHKQLACIQGVWRLFDPARPLSPLTIVGGLLIATQVYEHEQMQKVIHAGELLLMDS